MTDNLKPPVLVKPIPAQVINEGATFQFKLSDYIQSPDEASGAVQFYAECSDGSSLPAGIICLLDGNISGIPARETHGKYDIVVMAENDSGVPFAAEFSLTIKEPPVMDALSQHYTDLKAKVWAAVGEGLPLPDLSAVMDRPITHDDVYHLLKQFATLKIWDVYNLDPPGEPVLLELEGVSEHYHVYDRGCYIIGVPKDLFSYERTVEDALMTAKAMAAEVFRRGWTIEFSGFGKMARAAWVELQILGARHDKMVDVIHYMPSKIDLRLLDAENTAETVFGRKRSDKIP